MASDNILLRDIFPAGADLTGKEYLFVKFSSGALVLCGAAEGGFAVKRGATRGEGVTVDLIGISKITLGTGGGRAGDLITSDGSGRGVLARTAGDVINGLLLADGASGDVVPFLIAVPSAEIPA